MQFSGGSYGKVESFFFLLRDILREHTQPMQMWAPGRAWAYKRADKQQGGKEDTPAYLVRPKGNNGFSGRSRDYGTI